MTISNTLSTRLRCWPDYRTVWRWHFYAGLFCIPFVVFLALTGSIYLFKPQIESYLDRPYDHLPIQGPRVTPTQEVQAALASFPGSTFTAYELPPSPNSAGRVLLQSKGQILRVYVHPQNLKILSSTPENSRLMKVIFRLHGELLMGNTGSYVVELAASWAILMILSGLYLWWPRNIQGLGGVVYPRLTRGSRVFWRDLHSVIGVWVSAFALFLLLTGLPWAKFWGSYFKAARHLAGTTLVHQDWTNGSTQIAGMSDDDVSGHMEHGGSSSHAHHHAMKMNLDGLDQVVAAVAPRNLAPPVWIATTANGQWTAKSLSDDRPQRTDLVLNASGTILTQSDFRQRPLTDRLIGAGIAAHEGQLFGWPNQLLGLLTAIGLIMLSVSAVVLWWRRRDQGVLGAPTGSPSPKLALSFWVLLLLIAVYLPLFGISLILVLLVERWALRRIPFASQWLGLAVAIPGSGRQSITG
ncbi:MAG TPA: PepSY domain-containing protein [Phycisphaerae bacterium]|nr:PepSY domain-containing protein [Phycisphaerae bacterium]